MLKPVKEMLETELKIERQALKSWLFVSRYGTTTRLADGSRLGQSDEERLMEKRFKELTDELIRRRNEERERWKRTEQE
jgi:hypothetical protein